MIKRLEIHNFRSIRQASLDLGPITVLYGPNGSGKSSVLYALAVFKNCVLNPAQTVDGFFNLGFANCGGFKEVVFNHDLKQTISFAVTVPTSKGPDTYGVELGESSGSYKLSTAGKNEMTLAVSFPYRLGQYKNKRINRGDRKSNISLQWDGITASNVTWAMGASRPDVTAEAQEIANSYNRPAEMVRQVEVVPLKRGFTKPIHALMPISPLVVTEDEVGGLLVHDTYLAGEVSRYLERISDKNLHVNVTRGTAVFRLNCSENTRGLTTELVNEGFGVNQLVFLLAKSLRKDVSTICIEEPEIHLHPSATRKLAKVLIEMTREEGKQFIVSTHSETFFLSLLAEVAAGRLQPDDLACYLTRREKKETVLERQEVNKFGQVKGGLHSFMEGELDDLKAFFGQA